MKPMVISLRAFACMVVALALFAAPSQAQVVINELHYHPEDPNGDAEFIELYNSGGALVDISGWTLSGFALNTFTFPADTSIPADGYVVVARDAALLQTLTGFETPYAWVTGNLSNGGETVILTDVQPVEVDRVDYDDEPPWPTAPDGSGKSLELINPAYDNNAALAWAASTDDNGTPGAQNNAFSDAPIVIAESPARLTVVEALPTVTVSFSEEVQNVSAGDLTVNGFAAGNVSGSGAGPYVFSGYAAPTSAPITIDLAAGAIQDLDSNPFGGTSWLHPNVVINEIHYHPLDPNGDAEFIELLNGGTIPADISGWLLDFGPVPFQFPAATTLPAGDLTVVAMNPTLLQSLTGYLAPHQWLVGALSNGGELITLSVSLGVEADRVDYGDRNQPPWPAEPDGEGPSLELIHPSIDNNLPVAWKASAAGYGTPGGANSAFDAGPVVIAESPERGSFISAGLTEVSVTFHEEILPGSLSAGDLIVDGAAASGVTGSGAGPYVFTVPAPTSDQVAVSLGPGLIEDLAGNPFAGDAWQYVLALPQIVINEIHYHPADSAVVDPETQDPEWLQFIELYNAGASVVDLTDWRFTDGVTFDFPAGTSMAAGEYILVGKDGTFLSATVGSIPGGTQIFSWDGGDLDNGGERLVLTDGFGNTIDRVEYNDEGVWPATPDATGPSLELINPLLLNQFALSWEASSGINGTPGQQNSAWVEFPAPVIAGVQHDPPIPAGGAPVTITAQVFDATGFVGGTVNVCYRQDQSPTIGYTCAAMFDDGLNGDGDAADGLFGATVAGLADGQRMDFAVVGSTGLGRTVAPRGHDCGLIPGTEDCAGDNPAKVYLIKFSDDPIPTDFASYHLIVTQAVANAQYLHTKTEYDGTMVHCATDGVCEIHYNVVERYRGQSSLYEHPHSYNIRLPDNPVQSELGWEINELLLMGQQPARQELGYDLFEDAGLLAPRRHFVRVIREPVPHEAVDNSGTNRTGYQDYVYIDVERIDEEFMDSQNGVVSPLRFPDRCSVSNTICSTNLDCPGGEVCENTDNGNIYRGRNDADLRWEGPGPPEPHPGPYGLDATDRQGYQKVTNEDVDDWDDLIPLVDALNCSSSDGGVLCDEDTYDGVYESLLYEHLNPDQWGRWFAMHMVVNNSEGGLYRDTGDDYFVAFQPSLDHAQLIPWDLDAIFSNWDGGVDTTLWRTLVTAPRTFLRHNAFAGYFVGEVCRLLDNGFSVAEMQSRVDDIPQVLFDQPDSQGNQGSGPEQPDGIMTWVANRHTGILNQISRQTTLTGVPASPYTNANPVINLSGSLNQCGTRRVLVNGIEADSYQIANVGGVGADWSHTYTLVPGVNNIVVQSVAHDGSVVDSAAASVIYSPPGTGGEPVALKVTGPTRMVNTKTHTVRAEILDALGNTHWQSWFLSGTISARLVSDQTPVPISVTVFETFDGGLGAGGPAPGEIFFYNGLGSVSYTIDDPVSVAGQEIEVTVAAAGFSESIVVTALDETAPGLFKTLSGTISGADLTWDPSDGVIHITGNVSAGSNTLTIHPGTLIMVDGGSAGNGNAILVNNGSVQALGIEDNPIFFFATNGPAAMSLPQATQNNPPSWRGIDHRGTGTSNYEYVFLTGAGNGTVTGHPRPVILGFFDSQSSNVRDCVFADNPGKVLHGGGSGTYVVERSLISRAGIGGEYFGAGHNLTIDSCWFTRNGRAPEPSGVDGDALHLDTAGTTQLVRRSIIADCGDDAVDHNASFPVIEDSIIWNVRDKAASLTGGGITFDNVLSFDTDIGIRGAGGTVAVRNSTIVNYRANAAVSGSGPRTIDETITVQGFPLGSCLDNINYTLGPNANHVGCGVGNLSGNPGFQDPGSYDYSLQSGSQAAAAGPTGGRIGWLGFPDGSTCVNDVECDDGNACTRDACDAGACSFLPIVGCIPCTGDAECVDGDPCTLDTCSGGVCTNAPGNDGATCDDGFACTENDVCGSGVCAGDDTCTAGQVCGPTGVCILGEISFDFRDGVDSYTGTQDAHVREAAPGTTHGTLADTCDNQGPVPCDFFEWDSEDPDPFRNYGLLKFEEIVGPGAITQGSVVFNATLTIVVSDPTGSSGTIHPLLVDWDETSVTWNNLGGDAGAQPDEYGAQIALAPNAVGTYVIDITSTVQGWVNDPATNFGLLFLPTSLDGAQVRASEYSVIAERPLLHVELPDIGCLSDIDCDDGVWCNGAEVCDLGTCTGGTPVNCDDGVSCTVDSCNEGLQACDNVPTNSLCDDSSYCSGTETCDAVLDCQAGTPIDCGAQLCSDLLGQCVDCLSDLDCPANEVCTVGLGTCGPPEPADPLPIVIGDEFRYFKGTEEPSPGGGGEATTDWATLGFDDSTWWTGNTGFAYGPSAWEASDPDTNTILSDMEGPPSASGTPLNGTGYVSLYLRRDFHIDNSLAVDTMTLTIDYDDSFIAYVNGVEVLRSDLLLGLGNPPTYDQLANAGGGTNHEGNTTEVFDLAAAIPELFTGNNVLAFQVHNVTTSSSDMVLRPILEATYSFQTCTADIDCDDGEFCNGDETCNQSTNLCEPGVTVDCDDGVTCTSDSCNETTDSCDNTPQDGFCDDGNACTSNSCDPVLGCQAAPDDGTRECDDDACTEGDVCSGGTCQSGGALDCSDGVSCTLDLCDSVTGCYNPDDCPIGEFCNPSSDVCEVSAGTTLPVVIGDEYRYFKGVAEPTPGAGGEPTTDWAAIGFDDSTWLVGASGFAYGESAWEAADPDTNTVLDDMSGNYVSVYLRTEFGVDNPLTVESMTLTVDFDDAVVAYVNGQEVGRTTLLQGLGNPPAYDQLANAGGGTNHEGDTTSVFNFSGAIQHLVPGNNVLAFQLHNSTLVNPDAVLRPIVEATFTGEVCTTDAQCDDLQYCNGVETCNLATNLCEPGTQVDCDDGIDCTVDTCNEMADACEHTLCPMTVTSIGGRYLAVTPPVGLAAVALRVEAAGVTCLPQYVDENGFLVATPVYRTSAEWGTIFVGDREILPSTSYDVAAEVAGPQDVGLESAITWLWGDANNADGAEIFDMLCVADGFAGSFTNCTLEGDDVRAGIPDRVIDMDDVLAVLDGVALVPYPDADPCSGPPPIPPAQWQTQPSTSPLPGAPRSVEFAGKPGDGGVETSNLITLVPSTTVVEAGQEVRVDVFVRETSNLRGYQVALEVDDGARGLLDTADVEVIKTREDYAFLEETSYAVTDKDGLRLGAALGEGGIESYDPVYLGSFVFRATETAEGRFVIRFVDTKTFLRDDFARPIERKLGEEIEIRIVEPAGN